MNKLTFQPCHNSQDPSRSWLAPWGQVCILLVPRRNHLNMFSRLRCHDFFELPVSREAVIHIMAINTRNRSIQWQLNMPPSVYRCIIYCHAPNPDGLLCASPSSVHWPGFVSSPFEVSPHASLSTRQSVYMHRQESFVRESRRRGNQNHPLPDIWRWGEYFQPFEDRDRGMHKPLRKNIVKSESSSISRTTLPVLKLWVTYTHMWSEAGGRQWMKKKHVKQQLPGYRRQDRNNHTYKGASKGFCTDERMHEGSREHYFLTRNNSFSVHQWCSHQALAGKCTHMSAGAFRLSQWRLQHKLFWLRIALQVM